MKLCLPAFGVVLLCILASATDRPWRSLTDPSVAEVASQFKSPPPEYANTVTWGWSGPMTEGEITAWHWDFGDGSTSSELHPVHAYAEPGNYIVILDVEGPAGKSRRAKAWDIPLK